MTTQHSAPDNSRRWLILALVSLAQLMVVLDTTVVNIALPSAQTALHFSDGDRQWVVTAYALAFGSLLPLGGRIGDIFGRRRTLVTGLVGFAAVSAVGGLAQSFEWLLAARALQGMFGALLAPAALALLTTTFADAGERAKAFGVFGAIVGSGAAAGLLLGGVLTEYLSWRWCLFVNLVLALPAVAGALALLARHVTPRRPRLDLPGALVASAGLFLLVYGFSRAETAGWRAASTVGCLIAGIVMLAAFTLIESRTRDALLPLRVLADRSRAGSYLAVLFVGVGMFGVFLFVTYYLQQTLGYSPVRSGLAFMPMVVATVFTSVGVNILLLRRIGPRPLVVAGMLLGALGMVVLTRLAVGSTYAADVLPPLLIIGAGLGLVFPPATNTATAGIEDGDSGIGSALVNVGQQVGGSLGTALLNTVALGATTTYLSTHATGAAVNAEATVHGYSVAFWWAAAIFAVGAFVCGAMLTGRAPVGRSREADVRPTGVPAPTATGAER